MKLKLNQKGFSMMELLIALTVLALTAVPVYSMMVVAAQYVGENDMRADCLRLAENEMELQKAAGAFDAFDGTTTNEDGALLIKCLTPDAKDEVLDLTRPESLVYKTDGIYEKDGLNIAVYAKQINGNCYEVTVIVSEPVEAGAEGDEAEEPYSVTLKGVCVYDEAP